MALKMTLEHEVGGSTVQQFMFHTKHRNNRYHFVLNFKIMEYLLLYFMNYMGKAVLLTCVFSHAI